MNAPTTLITLAALPAIIAPAWACPYCNKYEPENTTIDWSGDVVVHGSDAVIHLLQPLVSGTVRAAGENADGFPEDCLFMVLEGFEDEPPSIYRTPGGELLLQIPENHEKECLARLSRGLNRLTENGRLRTVHMSELETVLSEELEYEQLPLQEVVIIAPPELATAAGELTKRLPNFIAGTVRGGTEADTGTKIRLSTHRAPAQATCSAKERCITLKLNPGNDIACNLSGFLQAFKEIKDEEQAQLSTVSERRLNRHFHEACRTHTIDWQHIALPAELGEEVAEWFRRHTHAKVEFYKESTSVEYTRHSLKVTLRYGGKGEFNHTLMTARAGIVPELHLSIAYKDKNSPLSDTNYRRTTALQLLEWLSPLMKDGKLPPISVEELQHHIRKVKRPVR